MRSVSNVYTITHTEHENYCWIIKISSKYDKLLFGSLGLGMNVAVAVVSKLVWVGNSNAFYIVKLAQQETSLKV